MTLSQWDLDNLSPEHQEQVKVYKDIWNSDPSQRESAHAAAEQIRAQYKYSGGSWGNQYNPFGADTMPVIPNIPEYESSYDDQLQEMFDQVKSQPQYESPYADLINKSISDIQNRPAHSYDPDNDPAYQAFLQRATRAGDKAYADNLGGLSAMTGGRPNSWAGTVASQARNQYMLQAQEAVIQFEERSYNRYQDETKNMYNFVELLQSQDTTAYNRYRDQIGDTKDLFNMVMDLDERDYGRWKDMADQSWKIFDAESQQYRDALQEKKDKIAEARDRTDMLGYVNNKDSITLGVPTGTLSQGARERAEKMEDYVAKQMHDLDQFRKEKEITHEFDLKMDKAREARDIRAEERAEASYFNRLAAEQNPGSYGGGNSSIGSIVAKYESNGNPGTVSSGKGDHGGVSYGIYQFSSKTGGAANFMNFLKTNNTDYYNELNKGGKPGSAGFGEAWKRIAARDPEGFAALQQQAVKQQYYDPAVANVKKATGIDVNTRSHALQEAIWSTAVQHGPGSVANIVKRALGRDANGKNDDAALISALYDERGANNGAKYFPSSSKAVQQSVANRFKKEKQDVLATLGSDGGGGSGSQQPTEFKSTDVTALNREVKAFNDIVTSKDFKRMNKSQQAETIMAYEDKVVNNVAKGLYGKNSMAIGKEIIFQMQSHPAYKQFSPEDPALSQEKKDFTKKLTTPGYNIADHLINQGIMKR